MRAQQKLDYAALNLDPRVSGEISHNNGPHCPLLFPFGEQTRRFVEESAVCSGLEKPILHTHPNPASCTRKGPCLARVYDPSQGVY